MEIETDSFFNYGFAKGIRPDPDYTVDEWADAHRILSSVSSSEPGPWQTSRVPYLREIENACQIERTVDVQVNIEQRVLGHRIERAVELHVLLQRNVRRLLGP